MGSLFHDHSVADGHNEQDEDTRSSKSSQLPLLWHDLLKATEPQGDSRRQPESPGWLRMSKFTLMSGVEKHFSYFHIDPLLLHDLVYGRFILASRNVLKTTFSVFLSYWSINTLIRWDSPCLASNTANVTKRGSDWVVIGIHLILCIEFSLLQHIANSEVSYGDSGVDDEGKNTQNKSE